MSKRLYRLPEQGQITGVAAGIAEYLDWDPTVVRALLVVGAFLTDGFVVIVYFVLAVMLPVRGQESASFGAKAQSVFNSGSTERVRNWVGLGLIVLGVWFLLGILLPQLIDFSWGAVWPVILILIGVLVLARGRR